MVYSKNYFPKNIGFGDIQTGAGLEQRPIIKFLVAENCKPYEIEQRIYDVYRETCLGLNISLPQQAWVKKTVHWMETHWLSDKENVLGAVVQKEAQADNLLGHERTHHYWFSWRRCSCKKAFLLPTP